MKVIQAAIYTRVSSEQQAAAHTIESQLAALADRARRDGTPVPAERQFVDDGYSGATLVRPALDRLRDLAATGTVNRIYVHSPDRLARNYAYQVLLIDEWGRAAVEVVFLNRPLGQTPEDDLLLQVQGIVAEYERAKIMERSRRGKKHAAQRGSLNVMSCAPFGYRYVTVHDGGGQARFEPVPKQARIVKQLFEWIAQDRCSLGEVCRRLQEAGERTRSDKTIWSRQTVWHILQNPAYYGKAAFGKTRMISRVKGGRPRPPRGRPAQPRKAHVPEPTDQNDWIFIPVPPLIEPALYRAAQRQLNENQKRARIGTRRPGYLLQGLLACSECRYAYYGKTTRQRGGGGRLKDFNYYRCSGTDGYSITRVHIIPGSARDGKPRSFLLSFLGPALGKNAANPGNSPAGKRKTQLCDAASVGKPRKWPPDTSGMAFEKLILCIATVVRTEGTAPRKEGAKMLIIDGRPLNGAVTIGGSVRISHSNGLLHV